MEGMVKLFASHKEVRRAETRLVLRLFTAMGILTLVLGLVLLINYLWVRLPW